MFVGRARFSHCHFFKCARSAITSGLSSVNCAEVFCGQSILTKFINKVFVEYSRQITLFNFSKQVRVEDEHHIIIYIIRSHIAVVIVVTSCVLKVSDKFCYSFTNCASLQTSSRFTSSIANSGSGINCNSLLTNSGFSSADIAVVGCSIVNLFGFTHQRFKNTVEGRECAFFSPSTLGHIVVSGKTDLTESVKSDCLFFNIFVTISFKQIFCLSIIAPSIRSKNVCRTVNFSITEHRTVHFCFRSKLAECSFNVVAKSHYRDNLVVHCGVNFVSV